LSSRSSESSALEVEDEDWVRGVVEGAPSAVMGNVLLEAKEGRRANDVASDPAVGSEIEGVERGVVGGETIFCAKEVIGMTLRKKARLDNRCTWCRHL
jgi:hypothetical protein